ncbi:MAG: hypothetical protein RL398_354 [Planctomycetota bacterium]
MTQPLAGFPLGRLRMDIAIACAVASAVVLGQAPNESPRAKILLAYADHCHRLYGECAAAAAAMTDAVERLLETPDAERLTAARAAWRHARTLYGQTECFRFYGGPVDPVEGYLNAWPIDEVYIDDSAGQPGTGILQDTKNFPRIHESVLLVANERGGEANVTVGWHAIEFLLWGQDLRSDGPGDRPHTDFVAASPTHERRREYLRVCCRILQRQLTELTAAWAPNATNYRRDFLAAPERALRNILTGVAVLTAFELAGERLGVAYATQDQEQEHSCFSDTSGDDLIANQRGIARVVLGEGEHRPGVITLIESLDAELAAALRDALATSARCLAAIPAPFDVAMQGDDEAPGRRAMRAAIEALEQQSELLSIAGKRLGYDLPIQPTGAR